MRTLLPAVACLAVPAQAVAAAGSGTPELAGSLVQTVGALILVIGIILVLYYLAGRYLKLPQAGGPSRYIRVVETRHLAPKKSLVLIEVGGEYLLLSNSGDRVELISKVEMLEEIEVVDEAVPLFAAQLKQRIRSFAGEGGLKRRFLHKKTGGL